MFTIADVTVELGRLDVTVTPDERERYAVRVTAEDEAPGESVLVRVKNSTVSVVHATPAGTSSNHRPAHHYGQGAEGVASYVVFDLLDLPGGPQHRGAMTPSRACYWVDETHTNPDGSFYPILVEEGVPGFSAPPASWPISFEAARDVVDTMNAFLGLTRAEAAAILASSIAAGPVRL